MIAKDVKDGSMFDENCLEGRRCGKVPGGPTSGDAIDAEISSIVIEDLARGTMVLARLMPWGQVFHATI